MDNKFVCIEQDFVAGDQVDREDENGDPVEIDISEEVYQEFDMEEVKANTAFENWFKNSKDTDALQRHYKNVLEQNPNYPLCFKEWAKTYYKECVDI